MLFGASDHTDIGTYLQSDNPLLKTSSPTFAGINIDIGIIAGQSYSFQVSDGYGNSILRTGDFVIGGAINTNNVYPYTPTLRIQAGAAVGDSSQVVIYLQTFEAVVRGIIRADSSGDIAFISTATGSIIFQNQGIQIGSISSVGLFTLVGGLIAGDVGVFNTPQNTNNTYPFTADLTIDSAAGSSQVPIKLTIDGTLFGYLKTDSNGNLVLGSMSSGGLYFFNQNTELGHFTNVGAFSIADGLTVGSTILPTGAGTCDLGSDTAYFGDVNYKTLDDRGCLFWAEEGIKLNDGRVVSDLEALKNIQKAPWLSSYGYPALDFMTVPPIIHSIPRHPITKEELPFDPNNPEFRYHIDEKGKKIRHHDGIKLDGFVSILAGAIKEEDVKVEDLTIRVDLLEKENKEIKKKLGIA